MEFCLRVGKVSLEAIRSIPGQNSRNRSKSKLGIQLSPQTFCRSRSCRPCCKIVAFILLESRRQRFLYSFQHIQAYNLLHNENTYVFLSSSSLWFLPKPGYRNSHVRPSLRGMLAYFSK